MSDDTRRYSGMRALAGPLSAVTRPLFKARGLATARIVSHWADIVGAELADHSLPQRYVADRRGGGTLHIRVAGGWAPEFQHLDPLIRERINGFFGYTAVSRIALRQGPVPTASRPARRPPPGPAADEAADIRDPDLRAALQRLGGAVRARHSTAKKS